MIQSILRTPNVPCEPGTGLFLMPDVDVLEVVFDAAVRPAMQKNGINSAGMVRSFNSDSLLTDVTRELTRAEVIVADVSGTSDVLYVLGLAHGMRRCPVLISHRPADLPFDLPALRCITYTTSLYGLHDLREDLTRAIRTFLSAARNDDKNN